MAVGKRDFVAQRGFEPATSGSGGQRSDPLSYGRKLRLTCIFAGQRSAKANSPDEVWSSCRLRRHGEQSRRSLARKFYGVVGELASALAGLDPHGRFQHQRLLRSRTCRYDGVACDGE